MRCDDEVHPIWGEDKRDSISTPPHIPSYLTPAPDAEVNQRVSLRWMSRHPTYRSHFPLASHVMHHTSKHACISCDAAPHVVPCTNMPYEAMVVAAPDGNGYRTSSHAMPYHHLTSCLLLACNRDPGHRRRGIAFVRLIAFSPATIALSQTFVLFCLPANLPFSLGLSFLLLFDNVCDHPAIVAPKRLYLNAYLHISFIHPQ